MAAPILTLGPADSNARSNTLRLPTRAFMDASESLEPLDAGVLSRSLSGELLHLPGGWSGPLRVTVSTSAALRPIPWHLGDGTTGTDQLSLGQTFWWACVSRLSVWLPAGQTTAALNHHAIPGSVRAVGMDGAPASVTVTVGGAANAVDLQNGTAASATLAVSANASGLSLEYRPVLWVMLTSLPGQDRAEYSGQFSTAWSMEEVYPQAAAQSLEAPVFKVAHSFP